MAAIRQLSLRYLVRNGLRRGLLGGEPLWLAIGGGALAVQVVLRVMRRQPRVVFSEKLEIGESLVIEHRPPPPRRGGHNGRRESPAAQPQT
jgi:hypothetical protein